MSTLEVGQLELEPLDRPEQLGRVTEPADGTEPAAQLGLPLDQRDAVPAARGDLSRLQPGRAAADDEHVAWLESRLGLAPFLSADVRIVEAGDRQAADHAIDAALVRADAVPDPLSARGPC